ncbi:MAG TPA: hypothetical protein PLX89_24825, partial [Verrucomicrobiota bacterium]|nr:hypothetical protein [Verrucomicrobiota bacterium]
DSGTYSLIIDGSLAATGDFSFRLQNLTGLPALTLDTNISKTLTPGYSVDWYSLSGTAGQTLYFDGLGANASGNWVLFGPNLENFGSFGLTGDFEVTLPRTGNYLLAIGGNSASPVPYSFQVVGFQVTTAAVTLGTTVTGTLAKPGDRDLFTFTGTAGQRLYYDALDLSPENIFVRLVSPSGAVAWEVRHSSDVGPFTLTQTGTYTLVVDGSQPTIGDYSFRMIDLASATAMTLTAPVSGALNPRSRTDVYQFNGVKGHRIRFDSISATTGEANWRLVTPANVTLSTGSILTDIADAVIPDTGPMLLLVEGTVENTNPLNYQVRLTDVSEPTVAVSGLNTIIEGTLSGTPITNTFKAPAGLAIYFDSLDRAAGGASVEIRDPSNNFVPGANIGASTDAGPFLLPFSGTYSVVVRGTGNYRFRLLDLVAFATPLTLGADTSGNLDPGYRTDVYKFTGAPGQRLYYDALENDFDQVATRLLTPEGVVRFVNVNADSDVNMFTLGVPGTYFLFVESLIPTVADYRFRLLDLAAAAEVKVNTPVSDTISLGLGTTLYRLVGTPGWFLYFDAAVSNAGGTWALYGPNNEAAPTGELGIATDFELPLPSGGGTYVLALKGSSINPVPYSFEVVDPYGGTTPDGPTIISITVASGTATITWTSVAGKSYLLQSKPTLSAPTWTDVAGAVTATADTASKTEAVGANTLRFYRVAEQ